MRKIAFCLALSVLLLAIAACASAPPVPRAQPATLAVGHAPLLGSADATPDTRLAEPINDFGFDLLRALGRAGTVTNATVVSPLSLHAVLSMVANGADGETAAEMRRVLHENAQGEAQTNAAYANELARLNASEASTIAVANSLWLDTRFSASPQFVTTNRQYFGAEVRTLDLPTDSARQQINAWAASATRGKIPELLTQTPDEATRLIAINATYFLGDWAAPFDRLNTHDQPFASPAGTTTASMMADTHDWDYAQTPDYQAIRLPYAGDSTACFCPRRIVRSTRSSTP
jgi:serine protease inhibitor